MGKTRPLETEGGSQEPTTVKEPRSKPATAGNTQTSTPTPHPQACRPPRWAWPRAASADVSTLASRPVTRRRRPPRPSSSLRSGLGVCGSVPAGNPALRRGSGRPPPAGQRGLRRRAERSPPLTQEEDAHLPEAGGACGGGTEVSWAERGRGRRSWSVRRGGRGARKSLAERAVIPRPRSGSPKFVDGGGIENSRAIAHVCRLSVATRRGFSVVCLTCFYFSFFYFYFLFFFSFLFKNML